MRISSPFAYQAYLFNWYITKYLSTYTQLYSCKNQKAHLGVSNGELQLGNRQLGRLTVDVRPLQHPVDEGGGRRLGRPLRWKRGAARHGCSSGLRAIPLRGRPLDRPPLSGTAADAEVRRHLFQDCRPSGPAPAATPAAQRVDEEAGGRIMDKAHSPKQFSTVR